MAQSVAFSKLSTTLEHFNDALNNDKLDEKALQTVQRYLEDPEVTTLDKENEKKLERPLKQLELLRDQTVLARVSPTVMKQINRQLLNLAELITKDTEESKKHPFFIIVKLEVCFLKILSVEALNSSKQRQKRYEERMTNSVSFESSCAEARLHALYMDRQQRIINELMNAALFDVIQYFEDKNLVFSEHFTQEFLDSLSKKGKTQDKISDDVFKILSETAATCDLTITVLISKLKYAIIGYGERINEYTIPLQIYILKTESPSLMEFNKTVNPSSALSIDEVTKFNSLFQLYCEILLSCQQDVPQSVTSGTPQSNVETASTTEERTKLNITAKASDKSLLQETSSSSTEGKPLPLASSASAGKHTQPESPQPSIEDEAELNFIWIKPNLEDYYEDFRNTILPASDSQYSIKKLTSKIPDEWIGKRIFLCLKAEHVRNLLPRIHEEAEIYRIYVLCQSKAEEEAFRRENNKFHKVRIATNSRQAFIRQLALDVVRPFIDIGDVHFNETDYQNAIRWYSSARQKVIDCDDSGEKLLLPTIDSKLAKCFRA